jgi:acetyl-CoA synthetase|eukprot:g5096.t1
MSKNEQFNPETATYAVNERVARGAHVRGMDGYQAMYDRSINENSEFWGEQARKNLTWFRDFTDVRQGGFENGDVAWFTGGKLNVSYNCIDRHIKTKGDQVAIIWEGDEPGNVKKFTYKEVLRNVCQIAEVFKKQGVRKGDCVTLYMPMIPECAFVMLALTRLGAPHSVVFAGFSAEALRDRIVDGNSKFLVTADEGVRGGRKIPLKKTADAAVASIPDSAGGPALVQTCFLFQRTGADVNFVAGRDLWMNRSAEDPVANARPFIPCEEMDSEDTLFYLYTSGSTGKPKGIAHSTAGYLLYAQMTQKYVFDYREGDVYACVADCGWITGHTYIVYAPLANGGTTLMFESTPLYPNASRYWDMVERHQITQFYTAPTAIRALMTYGDDPVKKHDLSSLRVLGTVGEPINPAAWVWYYNVVGGGQCQIVDTWWQTETGGNMLTPLPGCTPTKPGSATLPFFGVDPLLVDANSGEEIPWKQGEKSEGVLCIRRPWPGMARTVFGNHERYLNVYMRPYKGYYFTGDGCVKDEDGFFWITGRVDDVMNVSGHRIGTAEIESAIVTNDSAAEAAVVGIPHAIKGEGIFCYVIVNQGVTVDDALLKDLKMSVRSGIGPFAQPDKIVIVPGLPKTRSGKIMRRILRKVAAGEEDQLGDVSTLADPSVVPKIIAAVKASN